MTGPFKESARFAALFAATYLFLEVLVGPIVAILDSGGHNVASATVAVHFLSVFIVFPCALVAGYAFVRILRPHEDCLATGRAILAGALTTLFTWTGLFLLDRYRVDLMGDLVLVLGKMAAAVAQGLTVVIVSTSVSLGLVWGWAARRRRKAISGRD